MQHDGRGLLELQLDRVLVHAPEVGDLGEERLAVDRLLPPARQRGDHILGRQLLAVVEGHALTELDGVHQAVPAHRRQALGQERDRPVGVVEGVEALEDVVSRDLGQVSGSPVRVERRGLAVEAHPQHTAALLGVGAAADGEHGDQREREQDSSHAKRVLRALFVPLSWHRVKAGSTGSGVSRTRRDGPHQSSGGRCHAQGWRASNAEAARRTSASACHRPTIWSPTGRPSAVKPQGTVIAGCPVRLNGNVSPRRSKMLGVARPPIDVGPWCGPGPGSAGQAPTGCCGVSRRSHVSKKRWALS